MYLRNMGRQNRPNDERADMKEDTLEEPTYRIPKRTLRFLGVRSDHHMFLFAFVHGLHPGAGAAGGMGGSLLAFLNAELKPGIQLMLEALDFSNKIKSADLIITGEGKADRQTLMGKVPSGILAEARKQNIPVILLAGNIEDSDELQQAGFEGVFSVNPPFISLEEAMRPEVARKNIQQTVESICKK